MELRGAAPTRVRQAGLRQQRLHLRRPQINGDGHQQATPTPDLDEDGWRPWSSAAPRLLAFV
jgi:hypothetical protein